MKGVSPLYSSRSLPNDRNLGFDGAAAEGSPGEDQQNVFKFVLASKTNFPENDLVIGNEV